MDNLHSEKYVYLEQLSTERLEEILRAHIEAPDSKSTDEEAIAYILEIIENREKEHPTGRLPDPEQAWNNFQSYYNTAEGMGRSLYAVGYSAKRTHRLCQPLSVFRAETHRLKITIAVAVLLSTLFLPSLFGCPSIAQMLSRWANVPANISSTDIMSVS